MAEGGFYLVQCEREAPGGKNRKTEKKEEAEQTQATAVERGEGTSKDGNERKEK